MGFWGARRFGQARLGEVSIGDRIVFETDGSAARPSLDWASEVGVGFFRVSGAPRAAKALRSTGQMIAMNGGGDPAFTSSAGGVNVPGDLVAAGGFRAPIAFGCGTITNVGVSAYSLMNGGMLRAGSIVGISYRTASGILNAGGSTTRIRVQKNGVDLFQSTALDTDLAAGAARVQTFAKDTYTFAATDVLSVAIEVQVANLAAATGSVLGLLEIEE